MYKNWEILVFAVDGSGLVNVSNHPRGDYDPAWSPDGSSILFRSSRDNNFEIYQMNADGSSQINLTNTNLYNEGWPAWGIVP